MANIAKKYINNEISYLRQFNNSAGDVSKFGRNLNLCALEGTIAPVFNRENEVRAIQKIMMRRTKPNVLLTGPAGCGKTAIAEALAYHLAYQKAEYMAKKAKIERDYEKALADWEENAEVDAVTGELLNRPEMPTITEPPLLNAIVYELSMNSMVSGSKYRGDFEEKMENIIKVCRRNPEIILFIDEIHQMGAIGQAEGASNMAQILKPALARADIRIIGATTTEESSILKKDKALARRFCDIEVCPLVGETAIATAESILRDYQKFHKLSITKELNGKVILEMVNYHIGGVFPNNFIDVIDETMSGAKFDGLTSIGLPEIKATLSRISGNVIL